MTELAGEWALVGRYTVDVGDWVIQYGCKLENLTRALMLKLSQIIRTRQLVFLMCRPEAV